MNHHSSIFDLAVIGSGGAGQMAVLRAVLNHLRSIFFLGDAETARKSRATWVAEVDNVPGMFDKKRPVAATTREVLQFIQKNDDLKGFLTTVPRAVVSVRKTDAGFEISDGTGSYQARFIVLCTGTMDVQPEIQGSVKPILPFANRGDVLYCIRCDGHRTVGHACAVIGNGAVAGWIAVMLKERYDLAQLYVLTHGRTFEGSREIRELLERYKIPVMEGEILAVLGTPKTGLTGFRLPDREIAVTKAFVALGSIVYNELAKQVGARLSARNHVIVNEDYETSVPGFFAAGDLVEDKKKQVYTAWDMAVDTVDAIDERIRILKRSAVFSQTRPG